MKRQLLLEVYETAASHSNSNGALLFLSLCVDLLALRLDTHSSLFCFPFFEPWPFIFSQNMCPQSPSFAGNTFELMDSFPESLNYSLCYQFNNKSLKKPWKSFCLLYVSSFPYISLIVTSTPRVEIFIWKECFPFWVAFCSSESGWHHL